MKALILFSVLFTTQSFASQMVQAIRQVEMVPTMTSDDPQVQINMDNIEMAKKDAVKEVKSKCPGIRRVEVNTQTVYSGYEGRAMTEMIYATGFCG